MVGVGGPGIIILLTLILISIPSSSLLITRALLQQILQLILLAASCLLQLLLLPIRRRPYAQFLEYLRLQLLDAHELLLLLHEVVPEVFDDLHLLLQSIVKLKLDSIGPYAAKRYEKGQSE